MSSRFVQVPAVFSGLNAYKNGVKCAVATQVGLVQFQKFTAGDCGAGPIMHKVNGKDNGGIIEFSVSDMRRRARGDGWWRPGHAYMHTSMPCMHARMHPRFLSVCWLPQLHR